MDKKEVLRKLKIFSDVVEKKYNPLKIVLFGSYVKGNFTIDSDIDIDVAVIVENIEGSFLAGTDKSGFLENILSYGEVVYERRVESVV